MKRILFYLFLLILFCVPAVKGYANFESAYNDYLFQFDQYRQKYNDFQIARNEYLKFNSLTSQTAAIQKTREMMVSRAQLLRAYLLLLNERITQTPTLSTQERDFYTSSIRTENSFLENHAIFLNSVDTIEDLTKASKQLEERYTVLQTTIRQTILGLNLARMRVLYDDYAARMADTKNLIEEAKKELTTDQLDILERWFLQIGNKRTLYQQKQDQITQEITALKGSNIQDLDRKFQETSKKISDALQELKSGTAYMIELTNAMKYKD